MTWKATEGDHQVASDGGASRATPFAYDYEPHTYSFTFTEPGPVPLPLHPVEMTGVIEVRRPVGGADHDRAPDDHDDPGALQEPSAAQG